MASDEYQSLAQQLDAPELLPFYRDSLRLWANRLALETHLAGTIKHRPALELTAEAAARFWRANNPVVLVSGFDPTTRHQDVRDTLAARLLPLDVADEADGPIAFIRQLFDALGPEANAPPGPAGWQPLFLSWDVAFSQAHPAQNETYGPGYLQNHYRLGNTDFLTDEQPPTMRPSPSTAAPS